MDVDTTTVRTKANRPRAVENPNSPGVVTVQDYGRFVFNLSAEAAEGLGEELFRRASAARSTQETGGAPLISTSDAAPDSAQGDALARAKVIREQVPYMRWYGVIQEGAEAEGTADVTETVVMIAEGLLKTQKDLDSTLSASVQTKISLDKLGEMSYRYAMEQAERAKKESGERISSEKDRADALLAFIKELRQNWLIPLSEAETEKQAELLSLYHRVDAVLAQGRVDA